MEKEKKYTKYEKAKMLGARSLQLASGAPAKVKLNQEKLEETNFNTLKIAEKEIEENTIPLEVRKKETKKN